MKRKSSRTNAVIFTAIMMLVTVLMISPSRTFANEANIEVVVDGIGSSPESATKSAIEQALMQAVGRLIDTETIIKKKTEIENEIRSVSKTIDRSMLEYSQGVIESYQQIAIRQEDGIYRVTALVQVRSKELTPLLDGVVSGSANIAGSLFSTFQVENEQEADRITMVVDKLFTPLLDWTAYELTEEQPVLLKGSPTGSLFDLISSRTNVSGTRMEFNHLQAVVDDRMYDGRFNLAIPYTLKMTDAYKRQTLDLLESTADRMEFDIPNCGPSSGLIIIMVSEFDAKCYIFDDERKTFWNHQGVKERLKDTKFVVQLFDNKNSKILEAVSDLSDGIQFNCQITYAYKCLPKPLAFANIGTPTAAQSSAYGGSFYAYTHPTNSRFLLLEELRGVLLLSMQEELAKRASNVQFGLQ